ncbi:MAG: hypothetical protein OXG60_06700 [Chloroflexi bacterium]|nr:hypothetical protein [Chloroflexota bacterium]
MKQLMIAVFCMALLPQLAAGQTVSCYIEDETCPEDFPPDADVIVAGQSMTLRGTDPFVGDADWYFYDGVSKSWTTLKHAEILPFASGAFDEDFDQLEWELYLEDADTAIEVIADGNTIDVMDERALHLINISAGFVLSLPFSEFGTSCRAPDGTHLDSQDWRDWNYSGVTRLLRCRHGFSFAYESAQLRTIKHAELIKAGVLGILNPSSPSYDEKMRFSVEHQLDPPEIWYYDSADYGPRWQIYLKLDGTYVDDLEHGTLGPQKLSVINLHDRLVLFDFETHEARDFSGGIERKRHARSALLNVLERALSLTPAKWLLKVETGDDNGLYYNLSSLFKYVGN